MDGHLLFGAGAHYVEEMQGLCNLSGVINVKVLSSLRGRILMLIGKQPGESDSGAG